MATRVLDQFVLVKTTMTSKKGVIILDAVNEDKDRFDYVYEVLQLGEKCERNIKIGDHPIFSEYVKFNNTKVIEKTKNVMVAIVIVHENDIIAIDGGDEDEEEFGKRDIKQN